MLSRAQGVIQMASIEQKQELIDTIKGPRYYRLSIGGYGGESAYINISKEAYEFWKAHIEEHHDSDLVEYLTNDDPDDCDYDELGTVPKEADFLTDYGKETFKSPWYEAPNEFCHQYGVEYGSAYLIINEVDSGEYMSKHVADVIDERVSDLVDKLQEETNYEFECTDWGEGEQFAEQGEYVLQMYSSEKGSFFDAIIETVGEFDPKKLMFHCNEYPNGEDIIDGVSYDGEALDNQGGDTNGKGYSAHVWKN